MSLCCLQHTDGLARTTKHDAVTDLRCEGGCGPERGKRSALLTEARREVTNREQILRTRAVVRLQPLERDERIVIAIGAGVQIAKLPPNQVLVFIQLDGVFKPGNRFGVSLEREIGVTGSDTRYCELEGNFCGGVERGSGPSLVTSGSRGVPLVHSGEVHTVGGLLGGRTLCATWQGPKGE